MPPVIQAAGQDLPDENPKHVLVPEARLGVPFIFN